MLVFIIACEAAGALGIRHSLRPRLWVREKFLAYLGRVASRDRGGASVLLPSHPRAKRVAGRGRGWGVLERTRWQCDSRSYPHPRPLPATRKRASGEGRAGRIRRGRL